MKSISFVIAWLSVAGVAASTAKGAKIRATVKNTATRDGDEVVELYIKAVAPEKKCQYGASADSSAFICVQAKGVM